MINQITAYSINDALHDLSNLVLRNGQKVTVRGQETLELHPAIVEFTDPKNRTLYYPGRGNDPFAQLAETLWVLGSPDNNIDGLVHFLPRAPDYADDGHVWRAGYPERLRKFELCEVNQLKYIVEKLRSDPETRQALVVLWNPIRDCYNDNDKLMESKDFPCSTVLNFLIRNGQLDLTFYIRSNDLVFGMTGINMYEFSVIQELVSDLLGVPVGKLCYIANSLHVYSRHYDKVKKLADGVGNGLRPWNSPSFKSLPRFKVVDTLMYRRCPEIFDSMTRRWHCVKKMVEAYNTVKTDYPYELFVHEHTGNDISNDDVLSLLAMRLAYDMTVRDGGRMARSLIDGFFSTKVLASDLAAACYRWLLAESGLVDKHDYVGCLVDYHRVIHGG